MLLSGPYCGELVRVSVVPALKVPQPFTFPWSLSPCEGERVGGGGLSPRKVGRLVITKELSLRTRGGYDVQNITDQVAQAVHESNLKAGIATLFCPGSTGGLTTIEFESGVVEDLHQVLQRSHRLTVLTVTISAGMMITATPISAPHSSGRRSPFPSSTVCSPSAPGSKSFSATLTPVRARVTWSFK